MSDTPKNETYKLGGEAMAYARKWQQAMDECRDETLALRDEFERRRKEIYERHTATFRECWTQIAARLGLTPDETWNNPEWGLDLQYLEAHGDAYVVHRPAPESPLASLFGGGQQSKQEEPPAPVDPSKLN